eukprot:1482754-Prymnesium_polylepis.1
MQAKRASGARSACHGWSAAGQARPCALCSCSSRHQPSGPHKATLHTRARRAPLCRRRKAISHTETGIPSLCVK